MIGFNKGVVEKWEKAVKQQQNTKWIYPNLKLDCKKRIEVLR